MKNNFPTGYEAILQRIDQIDPKAYGQTRNYVDGAVTRLSPYISRGVISTRQVLKAVLERGHDLKSCESLVKELCWRDYFQRVGQHRDLDSDLRQPQAGVSNHGIPTSVVRAQTGIQGIDEAIRDLMETGYMHNHCRMYTAFMVCNVAGSHWMNPARWMYYHLWDGDWASNACSWQWVAGSNSGKKYVANQENINRYTHTRQSGTYLDLEYGSLENMETPPALSEIMTFQAETSLPSTGNLNLDPSIPTFVYNYHNMDPLWHAHEPGNRVLLLEPDFFKRYPVSESCLVFLQGLGGNIPGLQVFVGSFDALASQAGLSSIHYKEHPLNHGYRGVEEPRDWISTEVNTYYPSFFAYWKQVEKRLHTFD